MTESLGAFTRVWLFADDEADTSGWTFGIAVQRADGSVAVIAEDRGYRAHHQKKKAANQSVDPTPRDAPRISESQSKD